MKRPRYHTHARTHNPLPNRRHGNPFKNDNPRSNTWHKSSHRVTPFVFSVSEDINITDKGQITSHCALSRLSLLSRRNTTSPTFIFELLNLPVGLYAVLSVCVYDAGIECELVCVCMRVYQYKYLCVCVLSCVCVFACLAKCLCICVSRCVGVCVYVCLAV